MQPMHAFLIVGKTEEERRKKVEEIVVEHGIQSKTILEPTNNVYTIKSVRELNKDLSLKSSDTRGVLIYNADKMTEEAANAFLKTLEEPGVDTIYILTAPDRDSVVETIVSRCEVKNIGARSVELSEEEKEKAKEDFDNLEKGGVGDRLKFLDKIEDREKALKFVTSQIFAAREKMLNGDVGKKDLIEKLLQTKSDLEKNINVKLSLTEVLLSY